MALGYAHPDMLLEALNSQQISEWAAYYQLEPWGFWVDWRRKSMEIAQRHNINRRKNSKALAPEDFMPRLPRIGGGPTQSVDEMRKQLEGIFAYAKKEGLTKKE